MGGGNPYGSLFANIQHAQAQNARAAKLGKDRAWLDQQATLRGYTQDQVLDKEEASANERSLLNQQAQSGEQMSFLAASKRDTKKPVRAPTTPQSLIPGGKSLLGV